MRIGTRRAATLTAIIVAAVSVWMPEAAQAASAAADDAGNYVPATFTNGSNLGVGFGAWNLILGSGATATLADSTTGSGNINSTNGFSFRFAGGAAGTYVDAIRPFNAPLAEGDVFSMRIAYNWDGGARGFNLLDAADNQLVFVGFSGGNTLSYQFAGGSGVTLSSDYVSTAVVAVVVTQLPSSELSITLTRNDGFTTNLVSTTLSSPAAKVKFYNGGHDNSSTNYSLFVNDLLIVPSAAATLGLGGPDAMAAGMTNLLTLTRGGGGVGSALTVTLSSSDSAIATVPATVDFNAGDTVTNFPITGLALGSVVITAQAAAYPTATLDVAVYDLGYDDTSYYPPGSFVNGGNGGLGFSTWLFQNNDGTGPGYTNFAGSFIGGSTSSGGGNVDSSSGDAFGIYANGSATPGNEPFFNAIRPFSNELAVGHAISLEMGVNFRNGAKGVVFQDGGTPLFEVATIGDDYVYRDWIGGTGFVGLGWAYAADTAISVELIRIAASSYQVSVWRSGSAPQTNSLGVFDLGASPVDEVRFYIFNTEGGGANNLYFNRLALFTDTNSVLVDGIPSSWWSRYAIGAGDRIATNNPDADIASNFEEYIADTDPTNAASFFPNVITNVPAGPVTELVAGPTTNSRVYDVWWTTNLLATPQTWTRYGLSVPGSASGSPVSLLVTNDVPTRVYRTGVTLP